MNGKDQKNNFSYNLISWHKNNGRHNLPWQLKINPYKVWVSEIMLQQTQVKIVLPYYEKFIKKYPSIKELSNSQLDDILKLWAGLGYYRRAVNLHKSSQIIKKQYKYNFPKIYDEIIKLPGIGKSTAGAIMSLAYKKKYPILDGNVKRVIKRYFAVIGNENLEKNLWCLSESLLPNKNNDIYTQSIMDLGSLVCTKTNPKCKICPVQKNCKSYKLNLTNQIPEKLAPKRKKEIKLYLLLIQNSLNSNLILMKKNSSTGIWANLWNLPNFSSKSIYMNFLKTNKISNKIVIYQNFTHNLTHIKMNVSVIKAKSINNITIDNYYWKNIYDNIASSKPVKSVIIKLTEELS